MSVPTISDLEFARFQRFIFEAAGITLASSKKPLVSGRLAKRLQACGFESYSEYLRLLDSGQAPAEVQTAIDLLTTNETYFFREPKHFDRLREIARSASRQDPFRVWSGASSSGEEAYSIAMVLDDCLAGGDWEVVGTDISSRVLSRARTGHYSLERAAHVPVDYLRRYCRRGIGEYSGTLLVNADLRRRVQFVQANLNGALPAIGRFDVIFLRNVMIYFNDETKRRVVARVLAQLKPGGYFFVGHSETLNGVNDAVEAIAPAMYRLPQRQASREAR